MGSLLKNGTEIDDPRIDLIEEFDARSKNYTIRSILKDFHYERQRSYTWRVPTPLQQGNEGGCVGFAWAHELIARPIEMEKLDRKFAIENIYWEAQKIDKWPGGVYPGADPLVLGTSILSGAKVLKSAGYFEEYLWAETIWDMVAVLGYRGPCVFGTRWYRDMHVPDSNGYIHPTGRRINSHCLLATGVKIVKDRFGETDTAKSYIILQNSWGESWGLNGRCKLSLENLSVLWEYADVCVPYKRRKISMK